MLEHTLLTKADGAAFARTLLTSYHRGRQHGAGELCEVCLGDFLADLLHLSAAVTGAPGFDFEVALRDARDHFATEVADEANEVADEALQFPEAGPFGNCPVCKTWSGYLNVGREQWALCRLHRTKWLFGENLLSSWRYETEADWQRHAHELARYREVPDDELYFPKPDLVGEVVVPMALPFADNDRPF